MYNVDDRDEVIEHRDIPQSSTGAPLPAVVATEHRLLLAYLLQVTDPEWDGHTVRSVEPTSRDQLVALVEFEWPDAHFFGPPNDEAFNGHPLAGRGLEPYGVFEIRHSSWVRQLERMNSVHPRHQPAAYERLRHFVFAFHDSTFECVAERFSFQVRVGSIATAVEELARRLRVSAS
jgi:hypothetical protein